MNSLRFSHDAKTNGQQLPEKIAQIINKVNQLNRDELAETLRQSQISGLKCAAVFKYAPAWLFGSETARRICETIINFTHPQQSGVCFARSERLVDAAETSKTTFERIMRGIGSKLFDSRRRFNKSTLRTLTAPTMRFILIGRAILAASLSDALTSRLFAWITINILGIIPPKEVKRTKRKRGEALKELQPRSHRENKNMITRARDLLSSLTSQLRQFARQARGKRHQPRDINRIGPCQVGTPKGFRGAETAEVITWDGPAQLPPNLQRLVPLYFENPDLLIPAAREKIKQYLDCGGAVLNA